MAVQHEARTTALSFQHPDYVRPSVLHHLKLRRRPVDSSFPRMNSAISDSPRPSPSKGFTLLISTSFLRSDKLSLCLPLAVALIGFWLPRRIINVVGSGKCSRALADYHGVDLRSSSRSRSSQSDTPESIGLFCRRTRCDVRPPGKGLC